VWLVEHCHPPHGSEVGRQLQHWDANWRWPAWQGNFTSFCSLVHSYIYGCSTAVFMVHEKMCFSS
jgi:hypothetical protein